MASGFHPPNRLEIAYRSKISELLKKAMPTLKPGQTLDEWLIHFGDISQHPSFAEFAKELARRMVAQVNIHNAKSWREAAARSQRSRMLYRLLAQELKGAVGIRLDQLIRENAELIRSIPQDVAWQLTAEIAKAQQSGARPETIAKLIRSRFPDLTQSRIHLISRTEVAKASSALTQSRSEELGLTHYRWATSEDQRVRPSHRKMDEVIVPWDDPPAPEALLGERSTLGRYQAGQCPNCRCTALPLLNVDDVAWPHKVYAAGRIQHMSRAAFLSLIGSVQRETVHRIAV